MDLCDHGNIDDAITLFDAYLRDDPDSAHSYFERGRAYLERDDPRAAIEDFERALAIDDDFPGARDWRARALSDLEESIAAGEEKLRTLRSHPDGKYGMGVSPQGWADCARYFLDGVDRDRAKSVLEEYFDAYEAKVRKYVRYATAPMRLMATILLAEGDLERARALTERAVAHDHSCPRDHEVHGMVLAACGEIDAAEAIYAQWTDGFPPDSDYMEDLNAAIADAKEKAETQEG